MKKLSPSIEDEKWRIRDARHTLSRAEDIKGDKDLMKKIAAENEREAKAIASASGKGPKVPKVPGPKGKMPKTKMPKVAKLPKPRKKG